MSEHSPQPEELARLRAEVAALRAENHTLKSGAGTYDVQSDIQFQTLFKHFPVPTYTWRWNGEDLVLIGYNEAAAALTKGDIKKIMGKTCHQLYHDQRVVYDDMQRCYRERVTVQREHTYSMRSIKAEKELITTYVFVPPDLVMIHTEDITERKAAEVALRESEERYRTLFQNAPIGLGVANEQGVLLAYNEAMMRPGGYTREDIQRLGNVAALYAIPEERDAALALARKQGYLRQHEVRFKRKDGTHYVARMSLEPILLNGQRGWQAMTEDITELKQLEEQLLQAQKIESVGRLAGGIAHDFNNMLTAIMGYTDLLSMRTPADQQEELEGIRQTSLRAAGLVRQLLGFARKQAAQPRVVNLNDLVFNMSGMLARLLGAPIELETALSSNLPSVRVDPGQFEQVLMNLSVNARDAMPEGGVLTLETRAVTLDAAAARQFGGLSAGDFVELRVSDTGKGMSAEARKHLFEPFFTTKDVGKGTGLGLATSYGIAKQNGGHLAIDDDAKGGATFRLLLPAVKLQAAAPNLWIECARPLPGREIVLLVEDEPAVRFIAASVLRCAGYTVVEAADGNEALRVFAENKPPVNVVVSDVVMPRMGGREMVERIHEQQPDLPVLFMSGYPKDELGPDVLARRGIAFQPKPFTPEMLANSVRALLDAASQSPQ